VLEEKLARFGQGLGPQKLEYWDGHLPPFKARLLSLIIMPLESQL